MSPLSRLSLGALALVSAVGLSACGEEPRTAQVEASTLRGAPMYVPQPEPDAEAVPQADPAEPDAAAPVEPPPSVEVEPAAPPAAPSTAQDPVTEATDTPETARDPEPTAEEPAPAEPVVEEPARESDGTAADGTGQPSAADIGDLGSSDDQPAARMPTSLAKGNEPTVLTFDDLASFVWVPPSDGTLESGTALGPPDGSEAGAPPKPAPAAGGTGAHHVAPKGAETSEVPAKLRKYEGKTVSVEGYMIPLQFDDEGGVRKFLLARYMMGCCFGVIPGANELVLVTMTNDDGATYEPYLTVLATGKFGIDSTGGTIGALKSLYTIEGESCRFVLDR